MPDLSIWGSLPTRLACLGGDSGSATDHQTRCYCGLCDSRCSHDAHDGRSGRGEATILKADVAIRKLFGWKLFPDASTFGKLLNTDFHSPYNRHYNHNQGIQTILRGQLEIVNHYLSLIQGAILPRSGLVLPPVKGIPKAVNYDRAKQRER